MLQNLAKMELSLLLSYAAAAFLTPHWYLQLSWMQVKTEAQVSAPS